jgi:hypothetical protein
MKVSNIKKYKSSLLGLSFIIVGVYLLVEAITFDYWIIGSLIVGGLLMLFTGDKFIEQLEKVVFGKVLFKGEVKGEQ